MRSISLQRNARALRGKSTDAERRLWYFLRARRTLDRKFRRQHPIAGYIVDFVCIECRLIVEVDGGQHQRQVREDCVRDRALRSRGFLVPRFWNNDVLQRTSEVLEEIWRVADRRKLSP